MRDQKKLYLIIITVILAVYYLICGWYLNNIGYANPESLFYIEKAKIVFDGVGNRIKSMGLTSPILPFYATFLFSWVDHYLLAPVIASCIGTAVLFYLMANTLIKRFNKDYFLLILLLLFTLHPGILYTACSGKAIYLVLIFFYLFFLNILKFYWSNTTFHVSIASICLVALVFCDYKFIWLTLFFIPLILSITIQSLNLGEKESIFRMFNSFNSPTLRRKLINKTFAIYVILFVLPIAAIVAFKLLNLTHANDLNYFLESPYATWNVLSDRVTLNQLNVVANNNALPHEISLLISAKVLLFCPLLLLALYLFRPSTYQVLTLLTPFAFIEFLHIKYEDVSLVYEYYLVFLILALLCVMFKAQGIKRQGSLKVIMGLIVIVQIYTGYYFLAHSNIADEKNFISMLLHHNTDVEQSDNQDIAHYINGIPADSKILIDDAIAYPIVASVTNVANLTMPYQDEFSSAIEAPNKYDEYILTSSAKNIATGYTQLNDKYITELRQNNSGLVLHKVYESDNWVMYKVFSR